MGLLFTQSPTDSIEIVCFAPSQRSSRTRLEWAGIRVWLSRKAQKAKGTGGDRYASFGNEDSIIAHQWPGVPDNNSGQDLQEFEDGYALDSDNSDSESDLDIDGKAADTEFLVDADLCGSSEEDSDWEP